MVSQSLWDEYVADAQRTLDENSADADACHIAKLVVDTNRALVRAQQCLVATEEICARHAAVNRRLSLDAEARRSHLRVRAEWLVLEA